MLEQKINSAGEKVKDFEENSVKKEVLEVQNNKELSPEQRSNSLELLVGIINWRYKHRYRVN
jgi:hypothetical protein